MKELQARLITGILYIATLFTLLTIAPSWIFPFFILLVLSAILLLEWPKLARGSTFMWALTVLYPITPFLLIIALYATKCSKLTFLLFMSAILFDTASYLVGKKYGKTKIAPSISPGKTYEGFCGGFAVLTIFLGILLQKQFATTLGVSVLFSLFAFAGDLLESYLKRKAGIKNSGTLLPGHGGLLDRFDSILGLVIPVFFLRNWLIGSF